MRGNRPRKCHRPQRRPQAKTCVALATCTTTKEHSSKHRVLLRVPRIHTFTLFTQRTKLKSPQPTTTHPTQHSFHTKMHTTSTKMEAAATTTANNGSKPLRRIRRSPTTVAVEEDNYCAQHEAATMLACSPKNISNGAEPTVAFCGKLNDVDADSNQQENRAERRRAARRRRGGCRTSSSRPDASGRIGKKECHLFAFLEQLEEQVAKAMCEA